MRAAGFRRFPVLAYFAFSIVMIASTESLRSMAATCPVAGIMQPAPSTFDPAYLGVGGSHPVRARECRWRLSRC
jgi:hypothetical protein